MKTYCKLENNIIGWPQTLPNQYKNVIGGFDKLPDNELLKYGFYPYNEPVFDPIVQELGGLVMIGETVTRLVIDKVLDIDFEKNKLISQLDSLSNEFVALITKVKLVNDPEPIEITALIPQVREMYSIAKAEIEALNAETINGYVLRGPQVEQAINLLKSYL